MVGPRVAVVFLLRIAREGPARVLFSNVSTADRASFGRHVITSGVSSSTTSLKKRPQPTQYACCLSRTAVFLFMYEIR